MTPAWLARLAKSVTNRQRRIWHSGKILHSLATIDALLRRWIVANTTLVVALAQNLNRPYSWPIFSLLGTNAQHSGRYFYGKMQNSIPASNNEESDSNPFDEALRRVNEGRKLVIYERETGLFAYWYIALRCEEECYRAQRYQRPLSIAVVEPEHTADTWNVAKQITSALEKLLRKADLPGYLGNARFVLVMPETDQDGTLDVLQRIEEDVAEVQWGFATFPEDGHSFDQLYEIAARRLDLEDAVQGADLMPFKPVARPQLLRIDHQESDFHT